MPPQTKILPKTETSKECIIEFPRGMKEECIIEFPRGMKDEADLER